MRTLGKSCSKLLRSFLPLPHSEKNVAFLFPCQKKFGDGKAQSSIGTGDQDTATHRGALVFTGRVSSDFIAPLQTCGDLTPGRASPPGITI